MESAIDGGMAFIIVLTKNGSSNPIVGLVLHHSRVPLSSFSVLVSLLDCFKN